MAGPEDLIKRVGRTTLTQEVVNQLAELIMKGAWKPGDRIPSEKELAARFGVGRSTIREALQSLVVIGVLETRAGGRSYVQEPTSELLSGAFHWGLLLSQRNLGDLTEVRMHVEVECAGLAAERRDEQDIRNLLDTYERMASNQENESLFMEYDNLFHRQVAEAMKNKIYVNLVTTIQSLVRLWYPSVYSIEETHKQTLEEHRMMLEAIQSGNAMEARLTMRNHISSAAKRLNRVLAQREAPSS
ncbi:FadR/GntR family transcriptional regulator [Ammoniphilus sp. 3BR4]|uniref:FadR/GntR family transcriptional regulator n=1 Tax=Ammoniphilus sp. 3BR4 TaxID=3158265 RepID=UPI0034678F70